MDGKKIFHENGNVMKDGVSIHISDKIDLKTSYIITDKEDHYIMIKGSIQQENVFLKTLNIEVPKYIKQILT